MIKNIAILTACLSLFACAGAQTKLENAKAKVDQSKAALDCAYDVLLPYAGLLEENALIDALKGKDIAEYLLLAGLVKADADAVVAGLKACKLEEVAK